MAGGGGGGEVVWNEDDWLLADGDDLGATPDGVVIAGGKPVGVVEVKFVSASWQGREPPAYYRAQAAFTADILGCEHYAVASWQQGPAGVMRPYVRFGKVSDGIPVLGEVLSIEEVRDILTGRRAAPEPIEAWDGIAEADDRLLETLDELRQARALKKEAEDREKAAKAEIFRRVGKDRVEIVDARGERAAEITVSVQRRLSTTTLREIYPDIWEELAEESERITIRA